jgi:phospholipid transport system transporter-binding protein
LSAPAGVQADRTAAGNHTVEILERSGGRLEVKGALTFATARRARQLGLHLLAVSSVRDLEVDCSEVTASDSAGLAVLLDWLASARQANRSLQFRNLPEPIRAVAQISDVREILEAGVRGT